MATYTLRAPLPTDGRLVIDVPPELAPGDELRVEIDRRELPSEKGVSAALALMKEWDAEGWTGSGRTKEEIDAELQALRDEWDED